MSNIFLKRIMNYVLESAGRIVCCQRVKCAITKTSNIVGLIIIKTKMQGLVFIF